MSMNEKEIYEFLRQNGFSKSEARRYIESIKLQNRLLSGDENARKEAKEFLMARDS